MGQLLIVGFGGYAKDDNGNLTIDDQDGTVFKEQSAIARAIRDYHVGGVILFSHVYRTSQSKKYLKDRNIINPTQLATLTSQLQHYSAVMREQQGLDPLPLFIAIDQEGGMISRLTSERGFTLPTITAQALGSKEESATSNKEKQLAREHSYAYMQQLAQRLHALHINVNFAPVVDVNINPMSPVIGALGRSYSRDPTIVVHQAQLFIKALHQYQIIAVLKHFPGHGSAGVDSHRGMTDVTDTYDPNLELAPYRELIEQGFHDMIMTTHIVNGQLDQSQCKDGRKEDRATWCPGTLSKKTLTILRKELGFKGVIISDDMTMRAITDEYPLSIALEKAVNAGVDMFIVANHQHDQTNEVLVTLAKLVQAKKIAQADIERSYARVV
ncbi:MAG: hypothetical protein KDH94_02940, partial [Coxiellaceae bacterium]|nr:hypothetical protein [Coxiellaceae bacterium]